MVRIVPVFRTSVEYQLLGESSVFIGEIKQPHQVAYSFHRKEDLVNLSLDEALSLIEKGHLYPSIQPRRTPGLRECVRGRL